MKFSAILAFVVIVVGLVASSSALPAQKRVIYYQRPAQYNAAPQRRMMYVQYSHPSTYARSTQAAEALVAGESVATGTYLEDCNHAEAQISAAGPAIEYGVPAADNVVAGEHGEDVLSEADAHVAQAVAEAYPAAEESLPSLDLPADVDIVAEENEVSDDDAKEPRDINLDADDADVNTAVETEEAIAAEESPVEEEVAAETPAAEVAAEADVETPSKSDTSPELPVVAPAVPVGRYLPAKKKVYVELDQSIEDTDLVPASEETDEDEAEEEANVAPVAPVTSRPARRPSARKPSKAARPAKIEPSPLPAGGTFFPINFGGTKGGAIAIANSFSTGEGGSATSHAIAYGSPEAASLRGCVSCKKS